MISDHAERFWSKADKSGDCWIWQGRLTTSGYGQFKADRKNWISSRVAYELTNGAIPPGLCVCHRCDNPLCVRPDHLWAGTNAENMDDLRRKGRAARGERNSSAKLTEPEVVEIKRLISEGVGQRILGERFGVGTSTIAHIATNRTWAHVGAKNPAREIAA